ncbi:hypothetical protein [Chishuiella sp.]|uniref:hypothetical protein n=1 Tax=Chishuiella sp. TaxID=1969467 RepID=UPI0028AF29EE|nr:hypothetical protein [Chishuiella sp.]
MKEIEFKKYLKDILLQKKETINSRISNLKRIQNVYGDLDNHYKTDGFEYLFQILTLKKGDEKKHEIVINGDPYTGTATFKSALGLYLDFKIFDSENAKIKVETKQSVNNLSKNYKAEIIKVLDKISYTKKEYKGKVDLLQSRIFEYLQNEVSTINWELEKQPSKKYKDAVDIFGYDSTNKINIVIELDTTRADQVAKKFTSRQALLADKNLLYISVCYPGTKKMSSNECAKYFEYCAQITDMLNTKECKKEYLGYFL